MCSYYIKCVVILINIYFFNYYYYFTLPPTYTFFCANSAEKRASWRAARLRSLEKGAVEAQAVIQNMTKMADDLSTETFPTEVSI